jgi:Carbohydrate esterase, sialic acid-specific acetylesterase
MLSAEDSVIAIGSCFARELGGHLRALGVLEQPLTILSPNFESMLADFRAIFGADIPAVVAEIGRLRGSDGEYRYQSTVRAQQEQAAAETPNVRIFPTEGLPMSSDGVHFTVASYQQIGARFANAWLGL